jgi:radical SAM protein, TIGR01212 family
MGAGGYRDFGDFLREHFPGKMQKLTVNAGFTCPNRDGTLGTGGCTYCNNRSFSPGYAFDRESVTEQLEKSKQFFRRKYPEMRYLAYFQSYTNSYGELPRLMALYEKALCVEGVDGLIIGTRPDCMPQELLVQLGELRRRKWVMVEYGAESAHNRTLDIINRCHTWEQTADAVARTHACGIPVGLHIIMGLPGEGREDMLATIDAVNALPVDVLKIHQLQIVRGTRMACDVAHGEYEVAQWSVDEYVELCCDIVERLRNDIAIERFVSQSPSDMLISPRWGLKNYEFTALVNRKLTDRRK